LATFREHRLLRRCECSDNWNATMRGLPFPPASTSARAPARGEPTVVIRFADIASGSVPVTAINAVTDLVQPPDRAHDIMEFLFDLRGQKPWAGCHARARDSCHACQA
jgi:hypothetical protein